MKGITVILCFTLLLLVHNGAADVLSLVNNVINNLPIQQVVSALTASFLKLLDLEIAKSNSILNTMRNGSSDSNSSGNTSVNNATTQQVVAAATALFLQLLDLERAKSNSILNALQDIQSYLENIELNFGKDLATDYFLEGTYGSENLLEYIEYFDNFTAQLSKNALRSYPDEARKTYIACYTKKVNSSAIPGIVNSVKDIISKGLSAEVNFTVAASKCIQGQRDKLEACLANASSSILPIVPENVINTKELVAVAYECMNKAADKMSTLGNIGYKAMAIAISDEIRFNLPPEFDPKNKTLSVAPDFVYPTSKINEVAALLVTMKKGAWEALSGRTASLSSVKAYLQPAVNRSLAVLDKIKVESSASFCLTNAKQAVADNANSRAQEIIQSIISLPPPPSEKEVADVEKAFYQKKVAEELLYSWAQCVIGRSWYIFDQKKLIGCIQESQLNYSLYLEEVKFFLDKYITRGIDIEVMMNQIGLYGERAFKKQLDTDLLALERCMKKNTKLPINPSVLSFV